MSLSISTIIYFLIVTYVILDLICWKCRKVAHVLFYFECFQIMIETVMLPHMGSMTVWVISTRFIAAVVFLAVSLRASIVIATVGAIGT